MTYEAVFRRLRDSHSVLGIASATTFAMLSGLVSAHSATSFWMTMSAMFGTATACLRHVPVHGPSWVPFVLAISATSIYILLSSEDISQQTCRHCNFYSINNIARGCLCQVVEYAAYFLWSMTLGVWLMLPMIDNTLDTIDCVQRHEATTLGPSSINQSHARTSDSHESQPLLSTIRSPQNDTGAADCDGGDCDGGDGGGGGGLTMSSSSAVTSVPQRSPQPLVGTQQHHQELPTDDDRLWSPPLPPISTASTATTNDNDDGANSDCEHQRSFSDLATFCSKAPSQASSARAAPLSQESILSLRKLGSSIGAIDYSRQEHQQQNQQRQQLLPPQPLTRTRTHPTILVSDESANNAQAATSSQIQTLALPVSSASAAVSPSSKHARQKRNNGKNNITITTAGAAVTSHHRSRSPSAPLTPDHSMRNAARIRQLALELSEVAEMTQAMLSRITTSQMGSFTSISAPLMPAVPALKTLLAHITHLSREITSVDRSLFTDSHTDINGTSHKQLQLGASQQQAAVSSALATAASASSSGSAPTSGTKDGQLSLPLPLPPPLSTFGGALSHHSRQSAPTVVTPLHDVNWLDVDIMVQDVADTITSISNEAAVRVILPHSEPGSLLACEPWHILTNRGRLRHVLLSIAKMLVQLVSKPSLIEMTVEIENEPPLLVSSTSAGALQWTTGGSTDNMSGADSLHGLLSDMNESASEDGGSSAGEDTGTSSGICIADDEVDRVRHCVFKFVQIIDPTISSNGNTNTHSHSEPSGRSGSLGHAPSDSSQIRISSSAASDNGTGASMPPSLGPLGAANDDLINLFPDMNLTNDLIKEMNGQFNFAAEPEGDAEQVVTVSFGLNAMRRRSKLAPSIATASEIASTLGNVRMGLYCQHEQRRANFLNWFESWGCPARLMAFVGNTLACITDPLTSVMIAQAPSPQLAAATDLVVSPGTSTVAALGWHSSSRSSDVQFENSPKSLTYQQSSQQPTPPPPLAAICVIVESVEAFMTHYQHLCSTLHLGTSNRVKSVRSGIVFISTPTQQQHLFTRLGRFFHESDIRNPPPFVKIVDSPVGARALLSEIVSCAQEVHAAIIADVQAPSTVLTKDQVPAAIAMRLAQVGSSPGRSKPIGTVALGEPIMAAHPSANRHLSGAPPPPSTISATLASIATLNGSMRWREDPRRASASDPPISSSISTVATPFSGGGSAGGGGGGSEYDTDMPTIDSPASSGSGGIGTVQSTFERLSRNLVITREPAAVKSHIGSAGITPQLRRGLPAVVHGRLRMNCGQGSSVSSLPSTSTSTSTGTINSTLAMGSGGGSMRTPVTVAVSTPPSSSIIQSEAGSNTGIAPGPVAITTFPRRIHTNIDAALQLRTDQRHHPLATSLRPYSASTRDRTSASTVSASYFPEIVGGVPNSAASSAGSGHLSSADGSLRPGSIAGSPARAHSMKRPTKRTSASSIGSDRSVQFAQLTPVTPRGAIPATPGSVADHVAGALAVSDAVPQTMARVPSIPAPYPPSTMRSADSLNINPASATPSVATAPATVIDPDLPHSTASASNMTRPSIPTRGLQPLEIKSQFRVLIVEDNPVNHSLLVKFMKRKKIKYASAYSGEQAIDIWRKGTFHIILMDIQLPGISGFDATREIRRIEQMRGIGGPAPSVAPITSTSTNVSSAGSGSSTNTATPLVGSGLGVSSSAGQLGESVNTTTDTATVGSTTITTGDAGESGGWIKNRVIIVALTASALKSDKEKAFEAGCDDFLTKPFDLVWLESKIVEWGCIQALIDYDSLSTGASSSSSHVTLIASSRGIIGTTSSATNR